MPWLGRRRTFIWAPNGQGHELSRTWTAALANGCGRRSRTWRPPPLATGMEWKSHYPRDSPRLLFRAFTDYISAVTSQKPVVNALPPGRLPPGLSDSSLNESPGFPVRRHPPLRFRLWRYGASPLSLAGFAELLGYCVQTGRTPSNGDAPHFFHDGASRRLRGRSTNDWDSRATDSFRAQARGRMGIRTIERVNPTILAAVGLLADIFGWPVNLSEKPANCLGLRFAQPLMRLKPLRQFCSVR